MKRIQELSGNKEKHFVLRIKNNVTLKMLENGKCKVGTGRDTVEIRVVMFCNLEQRTELAYFLGFWLFQQALLRKQASDIQAQFL